MPLAYSYVRFSSSKQAEGESLARQTRETTAWCNANGYELVRSYEDMGVSARDGKNSSEGALSKFISAVRSGKVPAGSALVVEQLDRLSRAALRRAVTLFLQILDLGVDIVTVGDKHVYQHEKTDPMDLMFAIMQLSAAHATNEHRIARVQDAMDRRRERANGGEVLSGRCPGWVRWDKEAGKFVTIPEKAVVVSEIFKKFLEGESLASICANLNEKKIPTMRGEERRKKATRWSKDVLRYILRSSAVVGRHTPGGSVGKPGETNESYYPAVVTSDQWSKAQGILDGQRQGVRPRRDGTTNLLSGLCRCSKCEHSVSLFRANGRQDSLHCQEPKCTRGTLDHRSAELAVLALLRDQVHAADIEEHHGRREELRHRFAEIEREKADVERQIDHLLQVAALDGLSPKRTADRLNKLEAMSDALSSEEKAAREELHRLDSGGVRQEVDALRLIMEHERAEDQDVRRRIARSLRQIIEYVMVNVGTQQLIVHLRGSGVQHVLTPISNRFRYQVDAPVAHAIQVYVPDELDQEVQDVETELLGGNILVDRFPLGDAEGVFQRPHVEWLDERRVLVNPRQLAKPEHETLSLKCAAAEAKVSHTRLAQLCRAGTVHGSYQGIDGRWVIPRSSLQHVQRKRAAYGRT